jgi:cation:H+ antiporter
MDFVIFIIAMAGLIFGADFIVQQSERIALRFNISEFVIGSTLIALGTSLPEMAASIAASINGKSEIAIANAVGSNIMNITLVLAVIFIIAKPFKSNRDFFAKDSIWALMPILVFILMSIDGVIGTFDAVLLIILMFAYLLFLFDDAKEEDVEEVDEALKKNFSWIKSVLLLIFGFLMVVIGSHFAVDSASNIAHAFGISEWVIGAILISFGTSLPELVVSVSAALKGKVEMAIGNIIGSNLANTTIVIGASALASTEPLSISLKTYHFDIALMTASTIMLIYITANKLYSRPAGISLLIFLALFLQHTLMTMKIAVA